MRLTHMRGGELGLHRRDSKKTLELGEALTLASEALTEAGVSHAVCGGLVAHHHGLRRAVSSISFLVGDDAFIVDHQLMKLRAGMPVVVGGWAVKLVSASESGWTDTPFPATPGQVHFVSAPLLIEMMLRAFRLRDQDDRKSFLRAGLVDHNVMHDRLRQKPELQRRLTKLCQG